MKNKQIISQKIADKKFRRKLRSRVKHKHPRDTSPGYMLHNDRRENVKPKKLMKAPGKKNLWQSIKQSFRRKIVSGKQK